MAVKILNSLVLRVVPVVGDEVNGCGPCGFHLAMVRTEAMLPPFFRHPVPTAPRHADYAKAARSENFGAAQAALRAGRLIVGGVLHSCRLATDARESDPKRRSQLVGPRSSARLASRKRLGRCWGRRTSPCLARGLNIQAWQSRQRLQGGQASA